MGISEWMRMVDAVSGLAQMTGKLRTKGAPSPADLATQEHAPGSLETRLAGVVVAALKEAFDRDRARMDLERAQVESERRRAEEALAAELRRQATDRALRQLQIVAIMAIAAWMLSAILAVWLPGMRAGVARTLLAAGWAMAFATLGCAFAGARRISAGTTGATLAHDSPYNAPAQLAPAGSAVASAAPWLLLLALGAIAASLLTAS